MDGLKRDLQVLMDREKIRDCLARLSRGLDRRDAALVRGGYWPEATEDEGVFCGSVQEFLHWVVPGAPAMRLTLHTLGQSLIDLRGTGAVVETHVTAYHRVDSGGADRDVFLGGRYLDRMEKRGAEWRIIHRTLLYDWLGDAGPSVDWANGAFGMKFLGPHSVGSAHGDFSVAAFG